jgi:hypothetical protein
MTTRKISPNFMRTALLVLTVLAALKVLFVGFGLDEEYQIVMSYRIATGDTMFRTALEPHQMSSFLCTPLILLYLALFHTTTGIVLYLRLCGTAIHLGITLLLVRSLRSSLDEQLCFYLGLLYFNILPKQIITPEFGIMQVWFLTLFFCCLRWDRRTEGKSLLPVLLAGLCMAAETLSYPSCVILFPLLLFFLLRRRPAHRAAAGLTFTATCLVCGAVYLLFILGGRSLSELLEVFSFLVAGDATHSIGLGMRLLHLLRDCGLYTLTEGLLFAVSYAAELLLAKKRGEEKKIPRMLAVSVFLACLLQVILWTFAHQGYESFSIYLVHPAVAGLFAGTKLKKTERADWHEWILASLLSLLAVVLLTDLGLTESIPHGLLGALAGVVLYWNVSRRSSEHGSLPAARAALIVLCLTAIFGKGYTLRGGSHQSILEVRNIMKHGPAIGIFSDYMCAHIYNCNWEDWQENVSEGDRVLVVVDTVMAPGTIQYLYKPVECSHFSVVNPTVYDERLERYWEQHPEKRPNVIITDCWFGTPVNPDNTWIYTYAEENIEPAGQDGRYIRIYRRD